MPNREKFIQLLYSRVNIYMHSTHIPAYMYVRVACVMCARVSVGILAHPFEINESNSLRFYESMDKTRSTIWLLLLLLLSSLLQMLMHVSSLAFINNLQLSFSRYDPYSMQNSLFPSHAVSLSTPLCHSCPFSLFTHHWKNNSSTHFFGPWIVCVSMNWQSRV